MEAYMKADEPILIPRISSVKTAVQIFYQYNELGINETCNLFACGRSKAGQLKAYANAFAISNGTIPRCNSYVNTDAAYEAWGLNISSLEARLKKAEKLNITT